MRLLLTAILLLAVAEAPRSPKLRTTELSVVRPNDNRTSAGLRRGDTLFLRLVVNRGRWYPQADNGPSIVVETVGEEGKAPQIPAPLIRVPTGTQIVATVRNALIDSTVTVFGLQARPAAAWDSVRIAPGATRIVRFAAGAPGTYAYSVDVGKVNADSIERQTSAGAFIVDPVGGRTDDRVFVINIWGEPKDSIIYRNALAINGRSWPYTERLDVALGDSVRFRVVNATIRPHPMHLHGFYFRVDSRGDGLGDTTFAPARRRLAVTEDLLPGTTMNMVWYADRPGNWLFHCHLAFHVAPEGALLDPPNSTSSLSHDASVHMAGLIVGIIVRPRAGWKEPARPNPQTMRLVVQEGPLRGSTRAMRYVLQARDQPAASDAFRVSGPLLVMTRGRPTDVTVVNRLKDPTGVHWHGLELESYSDGVIGWSGFEKRVAPAIAPNDSFVAHLTLARAGTFIYHTHLGDLVQLTSGLYGAIVVLEPGHTFDPRTDHVYVQGWDGPADPPSILVNGDSVLPPLELTVGSKHRFRFVNIGPAEYMRARLTRDTSLVRWRAIAKDGADLPPDRAVERPAQVMMDIGQTYDVEFAPNEPGEYALSIGTPAKPPHASVRRQRIIVR